MKKIKANLDKFSENSKKEGFCLLHHGGGKKWSVIYQHPKKNLSVIPDQLRKSEIWIGYLAYPNPHLKNEIENEKFYQFESSEKIIHKPGKKLYEKINPYKTFGRLSSSISKKEYIKKIKTIKELLKAGEIYQLNFAIRFRKKFEGNPYSLFLKWIETYPSPFAGFLNCGNHQILSNSPERLFSLKNNILTTQPIKGTASKGSNQKRSEQNLKSLLKSEKERAELDMITDLARNDIGQICEYGSLKLVKNRAVLELPNLWHTYSKVTGRISKKTKTQDVFRALFPGGSITGCPKKRAMEYIEKLEVLPRNIFTGSIGWMKKTGDRLEADFNIAIRTALVKDGHIEYWAGGGITIDSDPEKEYEECLLKAEQFLKLI